MPFSRGIFLTQGSNPGLLHYRQTLYHLEPARYLQFSPAQGSGLSEYMLQVRPRVSTRLARKPD